MIYELRIGHLNLIPYDPSLAATGVYDNIHIAIFAHYSEDFIPPHIKEVHSIHNREVSFETFQKLIALLGKVLLSLFRKYRTAIFPT